MCTSSIHIYIDTLGLIHKYHLHDASHSTRTHFHNTHSIRVALMTQSYGHFGTAPRSKPGRNSYFCIEPPATKCASGRGHATLHLLLVAVSCERVSLLKKLIRALYMEVIQNFKSIFKMCYSPYIFIDILYIVQL